MPLTKKLKLQSGNHASFANGLLPGNLKLFSYGMKGMHLQQNC